ncbi:hypothetical protein [Pseudocolwellia agarivorans]|uniref:hypothetical protein n=1 Tax=Pseudocolwellia agarivorans TaxID=1911682 RepID=UPI001115999C|nr:hypothetical protein [Pseudocolwellia agarivorans]
MKKLILIMLTSIVLLGCTSTSSIDSGNCIKVANRAENNGAKSGDDLYKECLDKQYQKNESKKGFWEKSAEGLAFFVMDIITS